MINESAMLHMPELPKIVKQRLREAVTTGDHPDPDTLNAFAENTRIDVDRSRVLQHLANCADCREIVALSLPQPDASQEVIRSGAPGLLSWPVLRWSAAAACIVVVGAAVSLRYRERTRVEPPAPASEIAELKGAPTPAMAPRPTAPHAADVPEVPESKTRTAKPEAHQLIAKKAERADSSNAPAAVAGAALQPSEPNAPASTSNEVELAAASPAVKTRDEDMVPGRAKDALQSTNSAARATGGILAKQKIAGAAPFSASLPPPTRAIPRWTLTSNGVLQRSLDSGRSWQTMSLPAQGQFRALSANGLEIWVGGSAGALYHSSDAGSSWTQVQPTVDGRALSADIIGVEFTDTLRGTLTTSGGDSWATTDSGQTWQKK